MARTERSVRQLLVQTGSDWSKDKIPRLGAALAYYTVFSLPGILLISLAIAGVSLGRELQQMSESKPQLHSLLGDEAAKAIEEILVGAQKTERPVCSLQS